MSVNEYGDSFSQKWNHNSEGNYIGSVYCQNCMIQEPHILEVMSSIVVLIDDRP